MTKSFDSWFEDLISNYVWAEPAQMHHSPETFRKLAHKVYMQEVASGVFRPIQEARKHVYNIVCNTPGDAKKVDWSKQALEKSEAKKSEEWVPITGEERQRRLAEYKAMIDSMPMINNFPRLTPKEKEENGEWIPVKHVTYPTTSKEEAYVRQRHLEYIKRNYEPRTGQKLPDWIPEDEFNLQYDNDML